MKQPFLDITTTLPWLKGKGRRAIWRKRAEWLIGVSQIRQMCKEAAASFPNNPMLRILQLNDVRIDHHNFINQIPSTGGLMIIANHPLGVADAASLIGLSTSIRPDSKTLANATLAKMPGMEGKLLPLMIFGESDAIKQNLPTLKSTLNHLKQGGVIIVFPAGAVSHFQRRHETITDSPWSEHIAKIALKAKIPILPIKYHQVNPWWFQLPGAFSRLVRTSLLLRCFLSRSGSTVSLTGGELISAKELSDAENPTAFLRQAVYQIHAH